MLKRLLFIAIAIISLSSYASEPIIMVVPDKDWCIKNGMINKNGAVDYVKALKDDNMKHLIVSVCDIFNHDFGMPVQSLDASLLLEEEKDEEIEKEDESGKTPWDELMGPFHDNEYFESELDKFNQDIIIFVSYSVKNVGPEVEVRIKGIDVASSKIIFDCVQTGTPKNGLLDGLVKNARNEMGSKLMAYFDDIQTKGHEGVFVFKIGDGCPYTFDSTVDINGKKMKLAHVIESWIKENIKEFKQTDSSSKRLAFEQVRYPMRDERGRRLDAYSFMRSLRNLLKKNDIWANLLPVCENKSYIVFVSKEQFF